MKYLEKMMEMIEKTYVEGLNKLGFKLKKSSDDMDSKMIGGNVYFAYDGMIFTVDFMNSFDFAMDTFGIGGIGGLDSLLRLRSDNVVRLNINKTFLRFIIFSTVTNNKEYAECEKNVKKLVEKIIEPFEEFSHYSFGKMNNFEKLKFDKIERSIETGLKFGDFVKGSIPYKIEVFRNSAGIRNPDDELNIWMDSIQDVYREIEILKSPDMIYAPIKVNINQNISTLLSLLDKVSNIYDETRTMACDKHPDIANHINRDIKLHVSTSKDIWNHLTLFRIRDDECDYKHGMMKMRSAFFSMGATSFSFNEKKYNIDKIDMYVNIDMLIRYIFRISKEGFDFSEEKFLNKMRFILKHEMGHAVWIIRLSQLSHDECFEWNKTAKQIIRLENDKNAARNKDEKLHWLYMYYIKNPIERKANEMMGITLEDVYEAYDEKIPSNIKKLMMTETNEDIEKEQLKMLASEV